MLFLLDCSLSLGHVIRKGVPEVMIKIENQTFSHLVTRPSIKLPAAVASNPVGEAKTGFTGPPPLPLIIWI